MLQGRGDAQMALGEKLISGYDLAAHLLDRGGVADLLRAARGGETDWLELKAGMCLLPVDEQEGKTAKDLYWEIAKEVIALMNTSGGAVIIGIQDKTLTLVPLEQNDPRHLLDKDIDEYIRRMVRPSVWPENLKWNSRGKSWEFIDKRFPLDVLTFRHKPYTDSNGLTGEVVVVLVRPLDEVRLVRHQETYFALFKRTSGDVGEAKPTFDPELIEQYKETRKVNSEQYAALRDKFDSDQDEASEAARLEKVIDAYYRKEEDSPRAKKVAFTSLDAEESIFPGEGAGSFYSPEAVEIVEETDDWLKEGSGDDVDLRDEGQKDGSCFAADDEDAGGSFLKEGGGSFGRARRAGDLLELLSTEPRVVVSGEPGGGKTTCLTYYELQCGRVKSASKTLAIFIPMGQWRRGGSLSIMMEKVTGLNAAQLNCLKEAGRLRLIIDAVNECPDEYRKAAINNIVVFLSENPMVPAVISTRAPQELAELHFPVFHVQPMDVDHRKRYLVHYLRDADRAEALLRQINAMPGGETIAENPMLLRLVVEVYCASPERQLPAGRAGLYRRSLQAWYKREKKKAENSGVSLPWCCFEDMLGQMAELAFKSRQKGFRVIPREELPSIWGGKPECHLEILCQGPIIACDEEFVRFRHETFQEYLCAECLLDGIHDCSGWSVQDYARWGMPLAYSVELLESRGEALHEELRKAAWALNPWLGVALTEKDDLPFLKIKRIFDGGPVAHELYVATGCGLLKTEALMQALESTPKRWYSASDVALKYVVTVSSDCSERWKRIEYGLIPLFGRQGLSNAISLAKNMLTLRNPRALFQYHAREKWDLWVRSATPLLAIDMVGAGLAEPRDFAAAKEQWRTNVAFEFAIQLLKCGIFTKDDMPQIEEKWIELADAHTAATMVGSGLVPRERFRGRLDGWLHLAKIPAAIELLDAGIVTLEEFSLRVPQWLSSARPRDLETMIKRGFVTRAECQERVKQLVANSSVDDAVDLIRKGLAVRSDFEAQRSNWLVSADTALLAVKEGFFSSADVAERIPVWKLGAEPWLANLMIEAGVASAGEFIDRFPGWMEECQNQYSYLAGFLRHFDAVRRRELVAPGLTRMIERASTKSAELLVHDGLATKEEIAARAKCRKSAAKGKANVKSLPKFADVDSVRKQVSRRQVQSARPSWNGIQDRIPEGLRVRGKVVNVVVYGLFVEVEPEVVGLVHVSEMSWTKKVLDARLEYKKGDEVDVRVLSVDIENRKIALSIRQAGKNPWETVQDTFPIGTQARGRIISFTAYGAFVELEGGFVGMIHVSDMSWTRKINHPSECLQMGQEVEAIVLDVNAKEQRISLGLKQAQQDPWDEIAKKFPVGSTVKGKVSKIASFGAFIELEDGVDGLVHISQISDQRIEKVKDALDVGQEVEARVVKVDHGERRIGLSIRAMKMTDDEIKDLETGCLS